jgi:hypothetical protein
VRYNREERIVSVALSEDARKLLRQVVDLREQHSDGYVPDDILWQAAEIGPVAYDDAAEELTARNLAESHTSDPAILRATPKGMRLAGGV